MGAVANSLLQGYFDCFNQVKNYEYFEIIHVMLKGVNTPT